MNRPRKTWKRTAFAAMALCIVVSLPLSAMADSADLLDEDRSARSAVTDHSEVSPGDFLAFIYQVTDEGRPHKDTTRAQYVKILYDAAGAPVVTGRHTFVDVLDDSDYDDALTWAEQAGVISVGIGDRFDPDGHISTGDALGMLCRAVAAVGDTVKDIASGVLAAYTGLTREGDNVLLPSGIVGVLDRITQDESFAAPCLRPVESVAVAPPSPI